MALYDPDEPQKSVDLLTEVILKSNRIIYCHFFMECGKRAIKQIAYQGKQIHVCDNHFDEIEKS
jgi:predicted ester cyclase